MGRKISGRIEKDLGKRIKRAKKIVFFLDYDGTLTPIRPTPPDARISKNVKGLLKKLAKRDWAEVFIISGRSLKNIKALVGLGSVYYSGNHGMELNGPRLKYTNPTAKVLKPYIENCYKILSKKIKIKKVILENKTYTLSVHYRLVDPRRVPELKRIFESAVKPLRKNKKIKITEGKKVLEVRPNIKWNKGNILNWILKKIKSKNTLPIYIGDDITDEDAFKALGKKGISILVSKKKRKTGAQYKVDSPKDVVKILEFVDKAKA